MSFILLESIALSRFVSVQEVSASNYSEEGKIRWSLKKRARIKSAKGATKYISRWSLDGLFFHSSTVTPMCMFGFLENIFQGS